MEDQMMVEMNATEKFGLGFGDLRTATEIAPECVPGVTDQLGLQSQMVMRLMETVSAVYAKLEPVLGPERPATPMKEGPEPPLSPLGSSLRGHNRQLQIELMRLAELMARLDI